MRGTSHVVLNCVICLTIFNVITSKPQNSDQQSYVINYYNDNSGLGQYSYGFETSNGIKQEQTGELRNPGQDNEVLVVTGSYSYTGPDGVTYSVYYIADENGYRARNQPFAQTPKPFTTPAPAPTRLPSYGYSTAYSRSEGKSEISCNVITSLCGGGIG